MRASCATLGSLPPRDEGFVAAGRGRARLSTHEVLLDDDDHGRQT